ncbi:MAG: 30S ribosomal protein S6e [archaeon]|nr:MAG: 30S ribosomal protein S6e [archaeon]
MASFKLVLSDPKTGKSEVAELKDATAQPLMGRKIGEVVDATLLGLTGMIKITGGSDKAGFPMRSDVLGGGKNYVLMSAGVGYKSKEGGSKKRRLVRGNTVTEEVYQVNAMRTEQAAKTA